MRKLYNIRDDIYNIKSRNEGIKRCVTKKLDVSFYNYDTELELLCGRLLGSNSTRVLKNIVKSQKKEIDSNDTNK